MASKKELIWEEGKGAHAKQISYANEINWSYKMNPIDSSNIRPLIRPLIAIEWKHANIKHEQGHPSY